VKRPSSAELEDPRLVAAVQMIQRTGARSFQIRYSDDEQPVVWMAVAEYGDGAWDAAAAREPLRAVLRLCETLIDGGTCKHCGRPTGFTEEYAGDMPLDGVVCWYRYDPELAMFRRGCE
jgi:hypothetical protein